MRRRYAKDGVSRTVTYGLVAGSALGAAELLPETMDDKRFPPDDDDEPSRLRTVLARFSNLEIPFSFFSFSSLGGWPPDGPDELMMAVGLATGFRSCCLIDGNQALLIGE